MKCGVDDTRLHRSADACVQYRFARTTLDADPIALDDATALGIVGMDLKTVFLMPDGVTGATRLRADVVLRKDATEV